MPQDHIAGHASYCEPDLLSTERDQLAKEGLFGMHHLRVCTVLLLLTSP